MSMMSKSTFSIVGGGGLFNLLSAALRLIPDQCPGKSRLGRMLLRPFIAKGPAVLKDREGRIYSFPSYAEPIAQDIFTYGAYERDTLQVILKFLPENGTFVDVGANTGTLAIPIAIGRPGAAVVCIEADPKIHGFLQENLNRNGCERVRTVCCVAGAVDRRSVPFFRAPDEKFGMGSLGPQFSEAPILLEQESLDSILASLHLARVDVLKIDVEGAELAVLKGAQQLLISEPAPTVIFEFADWAEARIPGQRAGDAQAFLLANGYRLFHLGRGGHLGEQLVAPRRRGSAMLVGVPSR